jgi:serine protease AprX
VNGPAPRPRVNARRLVAGAACAVLVLRAATAFAAAYDPATDMGSMYSTTQIVGAPAYWKAGFTGRGIDIAVIDTGVSPVPGLTSAGKVVNGPDLSFESQADNLLYLDTFGHGTHMAGIAAGRDGDASAPTAYVGANTRFLGVAPDARIVSLKVGDAHGSVDVTQVIAAIDWVAQHAHDAGLNIRVLNLSYGTDSTQSYLVDPLAHAVENAWKKGIVVVAAAGNAGYAADRGSAGLTDPGSDPFVLSVAAANPNGTIATKNDTVATFSSSGCHGTCTKPPDLVAPGTSIVSLRDPGSLIDNTYGATATVADRFFRGSGTSQATAVVSGAVALILQQRPTITPDALKRLLTSTSANLPNVPQTAQGSGEIDLAAALKRDTPTYVQAKPASAGNGSIDASRGSIHLVMNGVPLQGEIDIFGGPVNTTALALSRTAGTAWIDGNWNGHPWSGATWAGTSWAGASWLKSGWSNDAFTRSSWSGVLWSDVAWDAGAWQTSGWTKSGWSANNWRGDLWAGQNWQDAAWR